MVNVIAFAVIAAILGFAIGYIYKKKKRGARCIGCPDSDTCSANCSCCGGCHK